VRDGFAASVWIDPDLARAGGTGHNDISEFI
jgi:hypothetical protein